LVQVVVKPLPASLKMAPRVERLQDPKSQD
jgi:hypothetical protein